MPLDTSKPIASVTYNGIAIPLQAANIVTMTQSAYDAAVAAGTIEADGWYGVLEEE